MTPKQIQELVEALQTPEVQTTIQSLLAEADYNPETDGNPMTFLISNFVLIQQKINLYRSFAENITKRKQADDELIQLSEQIND